MSNQEVLPPPPPPPYQEPPCKDCVKGPEKDQNKACSEETCRWMVVAALVGMILILVLCVIWFSLDFTNNLTQADDAWFAMGVFILAFVGIILMLSWEYRCNKCFICTSV